MCKLLFHKGSFMKKSIRVIKVYSKAQSTTLELWGFFVAYA